MSIDLVKLDNLAVDFTDGSISPSFKTRLEIAKSTMEGMSSEPSTQAEFKMEGNIDQSATISSAGQMNPLNAMQSAKLDFLLQGFKLTSVSPYSGKYVGYNIAEGALDLDLKYRVDGGKFSGDNIVIVDQLTLGDKVDSPDATKLPVKMGIALLKGPDGRITLQVPVEGDVKDPKFDFAKTVTSSLTGAVDNASKSPYATIKDIDGFKGQDLRFIEFELGRAEFSGPAKKKLKALAKVLRKNSDLTLGIEGTADRQMDWPKMSGKQAKKERTDGKQKDAKTQQKGLAKDQAVDEDQLKKLALMRANEVKKYMMRWRRVPAERIQLKPPRIITTNKEYGQVVLYLSTK